MIYADENVWKPVAEGLRRRGWEVTTAREEGTLGRSDREHLDYAAERDWTVLTFDDDFLSLVDAGEFGENHSGVVYISQHRKDVGERVRRIGTVLERNRERNLTGEVVYA